MTVVGWARLHSAVRCGLRVGAWYRVSTLTAREARVQVHGRDVGVARALLEFRDTPPDAWTVVAAGVADAYLVCPNCRYRDLLPPVRAATRRCARCNEAFPVAWDQPYPRAAATTSARESQHSVRETLGRDRRMTRRRSVSDRRSGERRVAERRTLSLAIPVERRLAERRVGSDRRSGRERRSGADRRHRAVTW